MNFILYKLTTIDKTWNTLEYCDKYTQLITLNQLFSTHYLATLYILITKNVYRTSQPSKFSQYFMYSIVYIPEGYQMCVGVCMPHGIH